MTDNLTLHYEYEEKAVEEIRKINLAYGYYPFFKNALEYSKESVKYAELELLENGFCVFDRFTFYNVINDITDFYLDLSDFEFEEFNDDYRNNSYQKCAIKWLYLKYIRDIVDLLSYISQIYEKYMRGTTDELYVKHLLMFFITMMSFNTMICHDNKRLEFIGLRSEEKRKYLLLFDKLESEGIHKIEFSDRAMFFHQSLDCIDRESVEDFQIRQENEINRIKQSSQTGCYIATCVYGSYDCPQVWTLRRFRDYKLSHSFIGCLFIKVYYTISPRLVKTFGEKALFRKFWRGFLDKLVKNLIDDGYDDTPYYDR